jgi:hypothetical protein
MAFVGVFDEKGMQMDQYFASRSIVIKKVQ